MHVAPVVLAMMCGMLAFRLMLLEDIGVPLFLRLNLLDVCGVIRGDVDLNSLRGACDFDVFAHVYHLNTLRLDALLSGRFSAVA
jgi:hypothetical protein